MKRKGCSIIIINNMNKILLMLRDDNPNIPYPNTWDVPGGHVESDESPEQCIIREMEEELGIMLKDFHLFSVMEFIDRIEYTYWKSDDLDISAIALNEGQRIEWFGRKEVKEMNLAYGFNEIVKDFYKKSPHKNLP